MSIGFAAQKMFALSALKLGGNDPILEEALRVQNDWMEIHGLFTSSNLVRGTMKDRVAADYSSELFK